VTGRDWKHSAMRLAASRTNATHQSTNRRLMNSVCPPRCPLHSPGLTLHAHMHVASHWRRVHHRDRHQHTIPIALAALPGAHTSRDFVPWRFLDAGQFSVQSVSSLPTSKNLHKMAMLPLSKTEEAVRRLEAVSFYRVRRFRTVRFPQPSGRMRNSLLWLRARV
jgi:hypothetical protein